VSNTLNKNRLHFYIGLALAAAIIISGAGVAVDLLASGPQTEPDLNVRVTDFYPQGDVERQMNITVKFSRDMVPEDSLDKAVLEPPIEFDPPLPGLARWIEKNMLRFYPDQSLKPATTYEAKVKSEEKFLYGNRINDKSIFAFRTPPLVVLKKTSEIQVLDDDKPGYARLDIGFFFNYPVNVEQALKLISITGDKNAEIAKPSIDLNYLTDEYRETSSGGKIVQYAGGIIIRTQPIRLSNLKQSYRIILNKGLECRECTDPLLDNFEKIIYLESSERLRVENFYANTAGEFGYISIRFNGPIGGKDLVDYIKIDPELPVTSEARGSTLNIRGNFLPGKTYEVTLSKGLPGIRGLGLADEFSTKIRIPDLKPAVKFTSTGVYLPREGAKLLELETTNIDEISVEVGQIFSNNIVYEMTSQGNYNNRYNSDLSKVGRKFFEKNKKLNGEFNKPLTTTIDIGGIIGDTTKGIFKISARNKEGRWTQDTRMVMMTDIGISARLSDDYLMVWANSLADASPVSKATVELISKNNQILVSGKTDSRGIAIFKNIKDKLEGFEPFLITVTDKDDMSYLKFAECLLPTSDFEIKGRPYLTSGYDAFMYPDRGVYRPGETAHITCVVRGPDGTTPPQFPYFITIYDPGQREFQKFRMQNEGTGLVSIDLEIPDFAKTGKYRIVSHIGDDMNIGTTEILVEEFMPDRIRVDVTTDKTAYFTGDSMKINVTGNYFFGAPAAGHKVSGRMTIDSYQFQSPKHTKYTFADTDRKFTGININLPDKILDDSGAYTYAQEISADLTPPSALKATVVVSVSEPGGRAVNAATSALIHPYTRYIGMRAEFEGYAKRGEPCDIDLIALTSDGAPTAIDSIKVLFYRVIYNSVLRDNGRGYYRYVSEETLQPADSLKINLPVAGKKVSFTPPDYGKYKIVVIDPTGGHQASLSFYASGWGYAPWSMENPDRVDIDLDRESYKPGDEATIQIRSPFGGKLLLTIEKDNVLDCITYEMKENTAEFTIPVKKDFFPNAYITATVIKKATDVDKASPARAFGVAPIMLDKKQKAITLNIDAPEVIRPKSKVAVNIDAGTQGVTELTVAAVDAGILRLTGFATPDPLEYYYGKRMLHLKPYDIYSFIYPEVERAESHLSPAGGAGLALSEVMTPDLFDNSRQRHLNPFKARRVKPVALWSGIVKTDVNGKAHVEFDIPEFNGSLVVMAVGVRDDKFGSASKNIIVRDDIIIQESFPRFVSPGDAFDGLVTLFNNTGGTADVDITLACDGPLEIASGATQKVRIQDNSEASVTFKLKARQRAGTIACRLTASSDTSRSVVNFELPNRPGMPLESKYGSGSIAAGSTAVIDIPGDWIETTDQYVIQTSSFAAAQFSREIDYLVRYPYGCLEQTTSRLFPLLYFNDLARFVQPEIFDSRGPDYFIREGILRLSGMMRGDGNFIFWPGGNIFNQWASIYASHFMVEAYSNGYLIEKNTYNNIIDNLRDIARGKKTDNGIGDPERIYAAYVLARAGKMENRIINYLKGLYTLDLPAYSRYQLAGTLAMSGDRQSALALLPESVQPDIYDPETGGRFDSGVRTNAILLEVMNDIDPTSPSCAALAKSLIEDAHVGRWYTTQATAYALMALGKYLKGQEKPDFTGQLFIAGDSTYSIGTDDFRIIRNDIGGKEVNLSIEGKGTCFYNWQVNGVPSEGAPDEYSRGISITREYLDAEGNPLDINIVALGDQVVCRIAASASSQRLENVVISDLLPAGFEVENPRLETAPKMSWIPKGNIGAFDYKDIRDDRLLLFTTLNPGKKQEFYYSLRAISAGKFNIPPIAAECMYNPMIAGASSSGVLIIKK